jgi:hypothetical protein
MGVGTIREICVGLYYSIARTRYEKASGRARRAREDAALHAFALDCERQAALIDALEAAARHIRAHHARRLWAGADQVYRQMTRSHWQDGFGRPMARVRGSARDVEAWREVIGWALAVESAYEDADAQHYTGTMSLATLRTFDTAATLAWAAIGREAFHRGHELEWA